MEKKPKKSNTAEINATNAGTVRYSSGTYTARIGRSTADIQTALGARQELAHTGTSRSNLPEELKRFDDDRRRSNSV